MPLRFEVVKGFDFLDIFFGRKLECVPLGWQFFCLEGFVCIWYTGKLALDIIYSFLLLLFRSLLMSEWFVL